MIAQATAIESSLVEDERKLLIVGDLLIDRTYYVNVVKLSPEAPIPVASLIGPPIDTPGGAGFGAAFAGHENIPIILSTYCNIDTKQWLESKFNIQLVQDLYSTDIETIIKTRYIHQETGYHLLRVDNDSMVSEPFGEPNRQKIWQVGLSTILDAYNIGALLILDYRKGLLRDPVLVSWLLDQANKHSLPIYCDSRSNKLDKFNNIDILKLNEREFIAACETFKLSDYSLGGKSPHELIDRLHLKHLIVTRGPKGAYQFSASATRPKKVYPINYSGSPDVTGCGDVFDVTFCYNWGIKKVSPYDALVAAVDRASRFAYEPVGERLKCQS